MLPQLLTVASGAKPKSHYVRYWVAIGWKADIIGSMRILRILTPTFGTTFELFSACSAPKRDQE